MSQRITYRQSMNSEHVVHYELSTDLGADEIKRRLRGNWLDRFRKWRDLGAYKRWERSR